MILDASTSRADVFDQQRELALSLIERLNISEDNTHVATGINSFTHVATLRQTLGLGRNRKVSFFIMFVKWKNKQTNNKQTTNNKNKFRW